MVCTMVCIPGLGVEVDSTRLLRVTHDSFLSPFLQAFPVVLDRPPKRIDLLPSSAPSASVAVTIHSPQCRSERFHPLRCAPPRPYPALQSRCQQEPRAALRGQH